MRYLNSREASVHCWEGTKSRTKCIADTFPSITCIWIADEVKMSSRIPVLLDFTGSWILGTLFIGWSANEWFEGFKGAIRTRACSPLLWPVQHIPCTVSKTHPVVWVTLWIPADFPFKTVHSFSLVLYLSSHLVTSSKLRDNYPGWIR